MGNKHTERRRLQRRRKRELRPTDRTLAWFPPPGYVAPGVQAQQATDLEWQLKLLEEKDHEET